MWKLVISVAIGIAVAAVLLAAPYGFAAPPTLTMSIAAALTAGAATAIIANSLAAKAGTAKAADGIRTRRLRDTKGIVTPFPRSGAVLLSVMPDTKIEQIEIVKSPASYAGKDVLVTLREGAGTFNPVHLHHLFEALKQQPGFVHLLLMNKHGEYVGYIPGFFAKTKFTGPDAEGQITRYVVDTMKPVEDEETKEKDYVHTAALLDIGGLSETDTISDQDDVATALARLSGFRSLVVLHRGNPRKPVGILHYGDLVAALNKAH